MLCNRLVEQLEPLADTDSLAAPRLPAPVRYRAVKLHLDMATSLLVFLGAYAPSYRERAEKLERFASDGPPPSGLPLPLLDLARKVAACTRFKLEGEPAACLDGWPAWREAVRQARDLWRWETSVLTGLPASTPDFLLWEGCMEAQPRAARLRGWVYAARAEGWRAWRQAPRWARLARRASPRHCVYAAGTGLLFALAGSGGGDAALERLGAWLPLTRGTGAVAVPALASDVAANYHRFLVGTRA
jgi:hypothetical protein